MDNGKLTGMELFAFPARPSFLYKPVRSGCWYVMLKLSYGDKAGYGGCEVAVNGKEINLIKWGACLKAIRSRSVEELAEALEQLGKEWPIQQQTVLQTALYDLLEVGSHHAKIAAGAAGLESYRIPAVRSTSFPQASLAMDRSALYEESAAYYSILR